MRVVTTRADPLSRDPPRRAPVADRLAARGTTIRGGHRLSRRNGPCVAQAAEVSMRARRRGMSLVEVMVVIAIVLTLMSVLALGVNQIWQGSRVDTTMLTLARIGQQVEVARLRTRAPLSEAAGLEGLGIGVPTDAW